jgi:Zn-dependent M28 family amino/carboxypeptidase
MTRYAHCAVLFVLLSGCANHAGPRTSPNKSGVSEAAVRAHLEFLASDALNGRGSGTRDEQIAAEYAGAQFRRLGFKPGGTGGSYVQTVEMVRATAAGKPSIAIGSAVKWTYGKEFVVTSLASPAVAGPLQKITGPATAAQRGAIVFLAEENVEAAAQATLAGAAAVFMRRNMTPAQWEAQAGRTPAFGTRISGLPLTAQTRPTIVSLNAESAAALGAVENGTQVRIDTPAGESQTSYTYNAVGILPGTAASGDAILITSHLDHLGRRETAPGPDKIFNGADDDASGTVAVLEIAEALAKRKAPSRTIIFACFGSEEVGGYGATYLRENPPVPLEKIVANVEFEMIGRPDPKVAAHTLWLTGYERSDLGSVLASHGARLVQDPHPDQNFFQRSDNYTLAVRGVVAHTVSSYNLHKEYHTPADETKLVDYAHMTESIASMVQPLWWLANTTFKPSWKPGKRP